MNSMKEKLKAFNLSVLDVSGEYAMVKKLCSGDKIKEKDIALEVLTSIKRAGADLVISYFGKEVLEWLR